MWFASEKTTLKVEFSDVVERDDILGKLHKLKDNSKKKKINITEYLAKDERNIVKSLAQFSQTKE